MRTALTVIASVAATVVSWHLLLFLALSTAQSGDAWLDTGRVWPYRHAHLNEEYEVGAFRPLGDPMFVVWAGLRNVVAFSIGVAVLFKLRGLSAPTVMLATFQFTISVAALQAIAHGLRIPFMREAYFLEWLLAGLGTALGLLAARTMGPKSSA